jgi:hypothetical protein
MSILIINFSAKSQADIEFLLNVIADFMGNMCPLNCSNLDDYVAKALELKCPNSVIPLLKNHRALLYYPDPKLITNIFKFFSNDWAGMKTFYSAISRKL